MSARGFMIPIAPSACERTGCKEEDCFSSAGTLQEAGSETDESEPKDENGEGGGETLSLSERMGRVYFRFCQTPSVLQDPDSCVGRRRKRFDRRGRERY